MSLENLEGPLSQFYGPSAIYVHQIERLSETNDAKTARCLYTVTPGQVKYDPKQLALNGMNLGNTGSCYIGLVDTDAERAKHHFKSVAVYPGHKVIKDAVAYRDFIMARGLYELHPNQVRLSSFDSVDFKGLILPPTQLTISQPGNWFENKSPIIVTNQGKEAVEIRGLTVVFFLEDERYIPALREDQLIEAMVQAAAATALNLGDADGLPLFQGIGRTRFLGQALVGETVEMKTVTTSEKRGFNGNVQAFVDGRLIAESQNMKAMIISLKVAEKLWGIKLDKS